jgi:hypothetical protein
MFTCRIVSMTLVLYEGPRSTMLVANSFALLSPVVNHIPRLCRSSRWVAWVTLGQVVNWSKLKIHVQRVLGLSLQWCMGSTYQGLVELAHFCRKTTPGGDLLAFPLVHRWEGTQLVSNRLTFRTHAWKMGLLRIQKSGPEVMWLMLTSIYRISCFSSWATLCSKICLLLKIARIFLFPL